ncbi:MAG: hypothetical protein GYB68_14095 [Chloroflexi bacterium]|nr:hypothetical protein [Chloroflexota bacterium]
MTTPNDMPTLGGSRRQDPNWYAAGLGGKAGVRHLVAGFPQLPRNVRLEIIGRSARLVDSRQDDTSVHTLVALVSQVELDWFEKKEALAALAFSDHPEALRLLVSGVLSSDRRVTGTHHVVSYMGEYAATWPVPRLLAALTSSDHHERWRALIVLPALARAGQLNTLIISPLLKMLDSHDQRQRVYVVNTLRWVDDNRVADALIRAYKRYPSDHILLTLVGRGDRHILPRLVDLIPYSQGRRQSILAAIAQLGDESVLPLLQREYEATEAAGRESVAETFAYLGGPGMDALSTTLRHNPDKMLQRRVDQNDLDYQARVDQASGWLAQPEWWRDPQAIRGLRHLRVGDALAAANIYWDLWERR